MSEIKKLLEMQANGGALLAKALKWFSWLLIVVGGILTITLIGAMAGVPLILMGMFMNFMSKRMEKQMQIFKGATSEQAEIIEHHLQKIRSKNSE